MELNQEIDELKSSQEISRFALGFGIFMLLIAMFNSKSFVNYSSSLDIDKKGILIKNLAISWHELMVETGFAGPRQMIEDLKVTKPVKSNAKKLAK